LLSHPFGLCEIEEGSFNEDSIELSTKSIIRTSTASDPYTTALIRKLWVKEG